MPDTPSAATPATAAPEADLDASLRERLVPAPRWIVIVWNDPINLMSYVTFVFRKLFGYSQAHAHRLMLRVHQEGRAVVSGGTKERCEHDVARLHAHGLWATMTPELARSGAGRARRERGRGAAPADRPDR